MTEVNSLLSERKIKAYIVGGFVRDSLLKRKTADIDIAICDDALRIAPGIADNMGGKFVLLDAVNNVARVILPDSAQGQWHIDFSTIAGDIHRDLARRDFTINAIGVDLAQLISTPQDVTILDPFRGRDDLKKGIIRATSDTVFETDAARLLRAVRLAAEIGFNIDTETEALIRCSSRLIAGVAGERVREELLRILSAPRSGRFVRYMDELGLLTAIIPELNRTKGVEQPLEHVWDVFNHSLETVRAIEFLLRHGELEYAGDTVLASVPWSERLEKHFNEQVSEGSTMAELLKLAALLHDIAKPETKSLEEGGRVRFLGHADIGAAAATAIMERLRFSGKEIKVVDTLIKSHLRPVQMGHDALPTHRAIYRFFRDTGDAGIDTLFLSLADHLAARGPDLNLESWQEHGVMTDYVLKRRFQEESIVIPPKLIDGNDLINIFGMSPGPELGKLLEQVREAQAAGEVTTKDEAVFYIKNTLLYKRM